MENVEKIINFTNKMKVLYVEDEEEFRNAAALFLKKIFLEVIIAEDGEEGLEKFYENNIDIVITDISLPKLDGLTMSKQMKNFDNNIPVIVMSGHNEIEYFKRSIHLDIDAYLLKPMDTSDLMHVLHKVKKKKDFLEEYDNNLGFLQHYQELTDVDFLVSKTDLDGVITYVNDIFSKVSGYKKNELIGVNHNIVRDSDNMASNYADIWHTIKYKKEAWKGILRNKSKNNETYYVNAVIKPILDMNNEIVEYMSIQNNVTDIISPQKQLYDFVDSSQEPLVVMVKIDGFTDIEKLYGHSLSAKIEEDFAKDLLQYMPKYLNFTKFFHLGSGQYIFVQDLVKQNDINLESIIEELINFQYIVNDLRIDVGEIDYDIAIVMSVANGKNCLENVKYGLNSLIKSKQDFIVSNDFAQIEQNDALNNLKILKMVKTAIDKEKIISFFQPIVCNETQEVVKYESLVRLIDEDEKIISPFFFLDIAKKGKYYSRITGMVLENSFNALSQTKKSISINISVLDIEKLSTRDKIYSLLMRHKEDTSRIIFELLEDESVKDFDEIEKFIFEVKKYGVKIAIDDFGAGYSNFERLLKYQPDILKIDGSLIKNIETDSYSLSVVKSIVAFAKEQGIEMVAEYIENENIYTILKNLGVEYSQGYYFGKPGLIEAC